MEIGQEEVNIGASVKKVMNDVEWPTELDVSLIIIEKSIPVEMLRSYIL